MIGRKKPRPVRDDAGPLWAIVGTDGRNHWLVGVEQEYPAAAAESRKMSDDKEDPFAYFPVLMDRGILGKLEDRP